MEPRTRTATSPLLGRVCRAVVRLFPNDGPVMRATALLFVLGWPLAILPPVNAYDRGDASVPLALGCLVSMAGCALLCLLWRRRLTVVLVPVIVLCDVGTTLFGLSQQDLHWAKLAPVLYSLVTVLCALSLGSRAVAAQVGVATVASAVVFWLSEDEGGLGTLLDVAAGAVLVLGALAVPAVAILGLRQQLGDALAEAERRSEHDPLTGVLNRRGLERRLGALVACARRSGSELTVLVADLDHFKRVNDTYGHATGDAVLMATADAMRQTVRGGDAIARLGGEEFAVVAVSRGSEASWLAERLHGAVGHANRVLGVTVSLGGVRRRPPHEGNDPVVWLHQAIGDADELLYAAKRAGRDRVLLADLADEAREVAVGEATIGEVAVGDAAGLGEVVVDEMVVGEATGLGRVAVLGQAVDRSRAAPVAPTTAG